MSRVNMPAAELDVDTDLVRRLLRAQRPDLAGLEITLLANGWDNFSFRIGGHEVARFPRREMAVELIRNESRWLPELASGLPLPVPAPEFVGEPGEGYPWPWLIAPFLRGQSAAVAEDLDVARCAAQIAEFLTALHRPAPEQASVNPYRGGPLADRDQAVRGRMGAVSDRGKRKRLEELWEESLDRPPYQGHPLWLHGDLHPHNLLADEGRLSAVVDFGDITAGDPATDLAIGWSLAAPAHEVFWDSYGTPGDDLRLRARGWAIHLGLAYLASSADNQIMESIGERTLRAVLDLS